jgi:uncharacterized lipoprotein YmbA
VLAENLSALLCVDAIVEFPRGGQTPIDYRVEVDVILLDGNLGGNASLVARWTVYAEDEGKVLLARKSSFSEAIGAQDYEALVSVQSRMIAALSQEIGDAIRASMSRSIRPNYAQLRLYAVSFGLLCGKTGARKYGGECENFATGAQS